MKIFVYGTLLAGEPNHHFLHGATCVGEATTAPGFALHDLGAYPGLVAGGTTAVHGEIYEIDDAMLAAIDALEDHPTYYQRTTIALADGAQIATYVLPAAEVAGHPIIASGRWRARDGSRAPHQM